MFNTKGGVGKTGIALNLALRFGYGVITNDQYSGIDQVLKKGYYAILETFDSLPTIESDTPVIFDFGGFPDLRAKEALKLSQSLIIPILPYAENLQITLDFIEEVKAIKSKGIIVIINKTMAKEFLGIKEVLHKYYPEIPVFALKRSKVMTRMLEQKKSISELTEESRLNKHHFKKIEAQFETIVEYLYKEASWD